MEAMGKTLNWMDQALTNVNTEYKRYTTQYNEYLQMWVDHGFIHYNPDNDEWSSVFTEIESLNANVNVQGKDDNYYHQGTTSTSAKKYAIRTSRVYRHWDVKPAHGTGSIYWFTWGLAKDYRCEGHTILDNCDFYFRSPYEALFTHGNECGGCNVVYYSCAENYSSEGERHKPRDCSVRLFEQTPNGLEEVDCPHTYRNCTPVMNPHSSSVGSRVTVKNYATPCSDNGVWPIYPTIPDNFSLTPGSDSIS